MKKSIALILCAILLCTVLSGCSLLSLLTLIMSNSDSDVDISLQPVETAIETVAPQTDATPTPTETTAAEPATEAAEQSAVQVTEPVTLVREYTKQYVPYIYEGGLEGQSTFDHLVRIPALTSDSADAQRINQEIYANCQEAIEVLNANAEAEVIYRYDYICKAHNGIVGLLMNYTVGYQSSDLYSSYTFYFFDANRGIELTYDEYLQALGMTRESAMDAIRAAGLVDSFYTTWEPEYLIVDETGTVMKVLVEPSMNGYILDEFDYSILEYPFH